MKSSAFAEMLQRAHGTSRLLVLLDFDGTLAPYEDQPDAVSVPGQALDGLRRLAENPRVTIGIVSGRSLPDLMERVVIDGIVYAGNHGIEIRGRGLQFVEPCAFQLEPQLKKLVADLTIRMEPFPNVRIENKRFTASMNLRGIPLVDQARAHEIAFSVLDESSRFLGRSARDAFDIVPRNGWHKGKAVQWIRRELGLEEALVVFAGDDVSDEDAFAALPEGITIKVGGLPTVAAFHAESPSEIWGLLTRLEAAVTCPTR